MKKNGPIRALGRVLDPVLVGGPWTPAATLFASVLVAGLGLQLYLGSTFSDRLLLGGEDMGAWRFLTFVLVNDPADPVRAVFQLLINLSVFGIVVGDAGQMFGTRRFYLYLALTMVGAAVGGLLHPAGRVVVGAIGPAAGMVLAFGIFNPVRRVYGRIPARAFAGLLLASLVGAHFLLYRGVEASGWPFAWQATGAFVTGYVFFLIRPIAQRRRLVREMFRDLRSMQEEEVLRERVDDLLEKISRQTIESLTREERRFLQRASRHLQEEKARRTGSSIESTDSLS